MSDPTLCRVRESDGSQCPCQRATETKIEAGTDRVLCKSCGHIESAHPAPPLPPQRKVDVRTFVTGFKEKAKLASGSGTAKASLEEATAETSAGLRPKKRKPDTATDTEPPSKKMDKGKGKTREPKPKGDKGNVIKCGKAVLIVCGISADGKSLRDSAVPDVDQMRTMKKARLVRLSTPESPISVSTAWSNKRLNDAVHDWFPEAMDYLGTQPYPGGKNDAPELKAQLWVGCIKTKKILLLAGDPLPTGAELGDNCKALGRASAERVLYIASKVQIPKRCWAWEDPDSEDMGSEIDTLPSEDIIMTPKKPAPQKKVKIKAEPGVKIKSEPGVQEMSEDESDMRDAAKKRMTRLTTGALTYNGLFLPESSPDAEESQTGPLPSGSTSQDVVVVSDSDDDIPPVPTLASVAALQTALCPKSLSPSPTLEPGSPPNEDPPSFFADFGNDVPEFTDFEIPPPPFPIPSYNLPPGTSSGSATSSTFPSWPPSVPPADPPAPVVDVQTPQMPSSAVPVLDNQPIRFRKMGRGRGDRDPWAQQGP
ncbi:hypothetical protein C8R47DRAFT_1301263 [Mycena vitilis]|nr:hypothetical protein C8R47DRAFT_1301263 [Mycena vitilis]